MTLGSYMHSPIGFGVYGEKIDVSDELTPLENGDSWTTPSQFSNFNGFLSGTRGAIFGIAAGIGAGVAVHFLKPHLKLPHPSLNYIVSPAAASVASLVTYWIMS